MNYSEWKSVKIKDISEKIFSGGTPSTKKSSYWNGEVNWLSSGETRNRFIMGTEKYITKEGVENSSTKLAKVNDIVIASAGQGNTRGQTSLIKIETYINQSLIDIRVNVNRANPIFVFYNISSRYNEIRKISDGHSIRGSLTTRMMGELDIKLPPLEKQKSIVKILSDLDEKIEINNKMNKNLEEIAEAIFKRWFVDFEFPDSEGKPYKSNGGEMVESEAGLIPKGWFVKELNKIVDVKDGTHDSPKPKQEGYRLITSKHIKGNRILYDEANFISKDDYEKVNLRSKVDKNDILITMIGTVGNLIIVDKEDINFAIKNIGLIKSSQEENFYEYLYLYLKSKKMTNHIISRLVGSTQKYISLKELRIIPVIIPSEDMKLLFKKIIKDIFVEIKIKLLENEKLEQIRDVLLPKLMSGEVRIPLN